MKKHTAGKIVSQIFLVFWLILCLFPLYWLFSFSLKDTQEIMNTNPIGLPTQWLFSNYANAWGSSGKISMYLMNSIIDTMVSLVITSLLGFMSAYGLLRMKWKGSSVVYTYILMGMMIPMHAALYPLTETLLPLAKTNWALIIPYAAFNIPITVLILSGFITGIPYEMEEAASIDGSGLFRTAFTIILPMMVPALVTAAIFVFLQVWNELLLATVLSSDKVRTLTTGIQQMSGQYQTDYGPIGAALVIATLPTLILYMCMSSQVQKSLVAGAVKG